MSQATNHFSRTRKRPITPRQRQILNYIIRSIDRNGYPPTIREIGDAHGIKSTNGVNDHLKALERKGHLVRDGLKSRALRPVGRQIARNDDQEDWKARALRAEAELEQLRQSLVAAAA